MWVGYCRSFVYYHCMVSFYLWKSKHIILRWEVDTNYISGECGRFFIIRLFKSILFFCQLNFVVRFPFLIKYYHIMFIIIVFRIHSDKLVCCLFYSLSPRDQSRDVTPRLGGGWMIFHFRLFKSILFFVKWISLFFFHLLYSTNMFCLLLLYMIRFKHALFLFLRGISTVLFQGISHGMWLLAC